MAYQLLATSTTVQVYGPQLASEALICTLASAPSGSQLIRTVPEASFRADQGAGLLGSLSDAVESVLGEGIAVAAVGTQTVDNSGLLADEVVFTVEYVPAAPVPGPIAADVSVPVSVLTADTQFGSFLTGGTAQERILDTYNKLKALAGE
jgi:hypothetical protein